jgi:hypothetical protein
VKQGTYFIIVDYNGMSFIYLRNMTKEEACIRATYELAERKAKWKRGSKPKVFVCCVKGVIS